jgi:lipopolysaccharide/colanic/teichoic acid biosynthesis glycosyltransferase
VKRPFDVVVALLAMVALAPLLALVAVLVRLEDGGPALFRQRRIGRGGDPFDILKFRTMRPTFGPSITIGGDDRITGIGRRLRRWKLDELPQLWNVLRGDMSLVGPRPEVPEYVALYPDEARGVLDVRPGITGPAQLEGFDEEEELRGAANPEALYREVILPRKLRTDLEYSRRAGLALDLHILWKTAARMLARGSKASDVAAG